ncbi:endolytic transglycosylase MltG [Acinetobacter sp. WZC-1]|uniref:endolytic transglycosylase MltG n=1 Tax=Acinetobacter sp. WZC-1 TaxID=3459034 RepID=UPI00403E1898
MPKTKTRTRPKKKKMQKKPVDRFYQVIAVLLITLVIVMAVILKMSIFRTYPVQGQTLKLSINQGETYTGFIDRLAADGKVHFPIILKLYRKIFIRDTLKAGVYEVSGGMNVRQVLEMVSDAENAQMNRILVIEGTTAKQLIAALKKDPAVKHSVVSLPTAKMLKALNIPYDHPEGLFAPDTYFFDKGATDQHILHDLYQRQMKILDIAWQKRAPNLPYKNKYEALIMASIIEKETSLDSELQQVSGVFVRRLKKGMRLQTDPTVIYGMGDQYQGNIRRQDLRTPTAYNTYTINGLPPTPIALPGKKAIEAAMHPDHSDTLYFVATGKGGHKFTSTLPEHNRAVQEYLTVLRSKVKE